MRLLKIFTVVLAIVSGAFSLFAQERVVAQSAPATERIDIIKTVHLFPNPAEEFVHVRSEHIQAADIKITLHNIIGNQIPAETEVIDEHEIRIRVKDFTSGYYLISLRDDKRNQTATVKFLKR
jgi:hypothetical protein